MATLSGGARGNSDRVRRRVGRQGGGARGNGNLVAALGGGGARDGLVAVLGATAIAVVVADGLVDGRFVLVADASCSSSTTCPRGGGA